MGDLRLFLFDMDGTLMVNQWEYHLSVVSMLKRLRTQGDMVILCTGRSRAHIPMGDLAANRRCYFIEWGLLYL